jgi:anti-sigma factor RsiW
MKGPNLMNTHDLLMLYLDGELDAEVLEEIEYRLETDEALRAEFEQLLRMKEYLCDWYEHQEEEYVLDGFSDRVMNSLGKPSWSMNSTIQLDVESAVKPQKALTSWWSQNQFPLFIGACAAAVIFLIANAFNTQVPQKGPSTVLIQDQVHKEASPVIWVLDEEESEHELDHDEESPTL